MNTKLRRWVDHDLADGYRPVSIFLPLFALVLTGMAVRNWGWPALAVVWGASTALVLPWYCFVGWRGWRLMKSGLYRGDGEYDRKGKYRLPPEYADTESATAVRRRRWRRQWRARRKRG